MSEIKKRRSGQKIHESSAKLLQEAAEKLADTIQHIKERKKVA